MTETRHVCGISGGKDSSALAIHMRDRVPEMEYFSSVVNTFVFVVVGIELNNKQLPFCGPILSVFG